MCSAICAATGASKSDECVEVPWSVLRLAEGFYNDHPDLTRDLRVALKSLPDTGWQEGVLCYNKMRKIYEHQRQFDSRCPIEQLDLKKMSPVLSFQMYYGGGCYNSEEHARLHYFSYVLPHIGSTLLLEEALQEICDRQRCAGEWSDWLDSVKRHRQKIIQGVFREGAVISEEGIKTSFPLLFKYDSAVRVACQQAVGALNNSSLTPQKYHLIVAQASPLYLLTKEMLKFNGTALAMERSRMAHINKTLRIFHESSENFNMAISAHNRTLSFSALKQTAQEVELLKAECPKGFSVKEGVNWFPCLAALGEHLLPWEIESIEDLFTANAKDFATLNDRMRTQYRQVVEALPFSCKISHPF